MRKNTSDHGTNLMAESAAIRSVAGERIAYMLRSFYRDCVDQRAARDFNVEPRTVRGWLAGNLPQSGHLLSLCHKFGPAFREFIFAPPSAQELAELDAEIAALRVKAYRVKQEVDARCGGGSFGG